MNNFWIGFAAFPVALGALYIVLATAARQSRAIIQWYLGIKFTRWWAMGLLIFALKHLHARDFKFMRQNKRLWISLNNHFFQIPAEDEQ
jgi:hypothetical protein